MGAAKTGGTIVGHCVGANGNPCGRPLASSQNHKALGAYENHGGMRCPACYRTNKRAKTRAEQMVKGLIDVALTVDLSWQEGAACAGTDSSPFTLDLNGNKIPDETTAAAWKFCNRCPIKTVCSSEADKHSDIGLRGGVFRILRPRVKSGEASRYKRYDVLAGEGPYRPQTAGRAA